MKIDVNLCKKEGMYFFFPDGRVMDFSKERIQRLADEYWNDPAKLPDNIRNHEAFKTCSVCPYQGQKVFCSAMKPLLPFLGEMEAFASHSIVAAVYVRCGQVRYVPTIALQYALGYVTNMALLEYCEDAKAYHKYFRGIDPLMSMKEAAARLFMNVFWLENGDRVAVARTIREMYRTILVTTKSCVSRLNLMCRSDAFMNAYIVNEGLLWVLSSDMEGLLREYFESYRR